jgi:hypothetical protein
MYQYNNYYDLESNKYNRTKKIQINIICISFILISFIIFKTISSLPIYSSKNIEYLRYKPKQNQSVEYTLPTENKLNIDSISDLDKYITNTYNELTIYIPSNIGLNNSLKYLNTKLQEIDTIGEKYTFIEIKKLKLFILENINKYKSYKDQL